MDIMTQTNSAKLNTILANAKINRLEVRRFNPSAVTQEDEERLKTQSLSEGQMALLDQLQVIYDPRPLAQGGSISRWEAMQLIDAALTAARQRRELARSKPASASQIQALINLGCNGEDLIGLTSGEASDLVRYFTAQINARRKAPRPRR